MGKSAEGDDLRFTKKNDDLYVTVLGKPKGRTLTIADLGAKSSSGMVTALGNSRQLTSTPDGGGLRIALPEHLDGDYAYSFKLAGYAR